MAEIVAKFDTQTKKLTVTVAGQEMANVTYISAGESYESPGENGEKKFRFNIEQQDPANKDGIRVYTNTIASAKASEEFPELPCVVKDVRHETSLSTLFTR